MLTSENDRMHEADLLRLLYDEAPDAADVRSRMSKDKRLRTTYERMAAVKGQLDERQSRRPSPQVIERITAYADRPAKPRTDREPVRLAHRRRFYSMAGAVVVFLLAAGIGWWQLQPVSHTTQVTQAPPPVQEQPAVETLPEWNRSDDVFDLYQRIQFVRARSVPQAWERTPDTGFRVASTE